MKKVYVLQIPNRRDRETGMMVPAFNVGPAAEFGEIEIIMPADASFYATSELVRQLKQSLKNYDPESDSVIASGDPSIIGAACAVLGKTFGRFTLLKWDRKVSRYVPIEVTV